MTPYQTYSSSLYIAFTTGDIDEFFYSSSLAGSSTILNLGDAEFKLFSGSAETIFFLMTLPPVSAPVKRELSESLEQSEVFRWFTMLAPVAGCLSWKVYYLD